MGPIELDFVRIAESISALMICSLLSRLSLSFLGQNWVKTQTLTVTIFILPVVTFIITKTISGNIALSLGMVGALSIVRFRNPVKSPLELSLYFFLIACGITASVSLQWLLVLMISVCFIILAIKAFEDCYTKITQKPLFQASFSEGRSLCSLTVDCREKIHFELPKDVFLSYELRDGEFRRYIFTSPSMEELSQFKNSKYFETASRLELNQS